MRNPTLHPTAPTSGVAGALVAEQARNAGPSTAVVRFREQPSLRMTLLFFVDGFVVGGAFGSWRINTGFAGVARRSARFAREYAQIVSTEEALKMF